MSYYDRIKKSNPYHDQNGRFATHDSAATTATDVTTVKSLRDKLNEAEKASHEAQYTDYGSLTGQNYYDKLDMLSANSKKDYEDLSDKDQNAILRYTSRYYEYYNKLLGGVNESIFSDDELKTQIKEVDAALEKTTAPENMTVYKAMNIDRLLNTVSGASVTKEDLDKLVGKEFIDHSFGSSSASKNTAQGFSMGNRIIVRIKLPQGTKGAWLGSSKPAINDSLARSAFPREGEFLLPRGRVYKVTKIGELQNIGYSRNHYVELELLNPHQSPKSLE